MTSSEARPAERGCICACCVSLILVASAINAALIRPQDIARDNSIRHTQIAEARVSYGGRGHLTDAQQARYGQQIYDLLFPF